MTYHCFFFFKQKTAYEIVRVHLQSGRPTSIEDFVTGWLVGQSRWGRPVGLLVMPDGALLVSDDLGGRIWRVSFAQNSPIVGSGNLDVTTSTSGPNQPGGYTVSVDGSVTQPIAANGSVTFTNLSADNHSVALTNVAANCSVSGANPQTVTVPSGGTATTSFTVSCVTPLGNLTVSTSTTGSNLDPDGYTVTVDSASPQAIESNGTL